MKTLGPAYRIVCRDASDPQPDTRRASSMERAAAEAGAGVGGAGRVLAVTSGFLVPPPLGLMHCDTLQVRVWVRAGPGGSTCVGWVVMLGPSSWPGLTSRGQIAIDAPARGHR